ncbi:PcfJ domain-containing protein [Micavibrio aeruginosavorus]|uniref:Uncharacterized protein n=1 Tax=Micavibrio aeruginosavorus EPB TaxID=349215 RepID=M4VG84_9BACT|nr:PcfJ domain-containing protein [Micavibrio aeruginosavorus]AGH97046.1 hypothetical protein A11S_210 [Micavibrio aeruginosavorus EPB]
MSGTLYQNKANRLLNSAARDIDDFTQKIVADMSENARTGELVDRSAAANTIRAILQQWESQTIPQSHQSTDGSALLILPYSELKLSRQNGNKKKAALFKTSRVRLFLTGPHGGLSVFKFGLDKNNGKKSYDEAIHYFLKMMRGEISLQGTPRYGKEIHDYDRTEFAKIFTLPDSRYHGQISPASYLHKALRDLAHSYGTSITIRQNELDDVIQMVEHKWLQSARYTLLSMLNRTALRAVLLNRESGLRDYQWLTKQNDPVIQDKRIGAYASYPGLMRLFTEAQGWDETFNRAQRRNSQNHATIKHQIENQKTLTRSIDNGASAPTALKEVFASGATAPVPPRYLAPYHGANDQVFDRYSLKVLTERLAFLPQFSREHYPKNAPEWRRFDELCGNIARAEGYTHMPRQALVNYSLKNPQKKTDWQNISDFVTKIQKVILLPLIVSRIQQSGNETATREAQSIFQDNQVRSAFMGMFTVADLVSGSRTWHDRLDTVNARLRSIAVADDLAWPALIPAMTAPNGVQCTPLTTKQDLETEGSRMHHCVGGYAHNCIENGAHILHLSFTEPNGTQHHSTLDLREKKARDGAISLSQNQNKKEWNKAPHSALQKAADWLIDAINTGKIRVHWQDIDKKRAIVAESYNKNRLINEIGFDPTDLAHCEEAYTIMSAFLPQKMRTLPYQDFIKQCKAMGVIQQKVRLLATARQGAPAPQFRR